MTTVVENTLKALINKSQIEQTLNLQEFIYYMEKAFQQAGFRDNRNNGEQPNILVTRLDAIGDNVLNSGFLRELRRNYPSAHITLVVNPTVYNLVEICPYVNEVLSIAPNGNFILWINDAINLCREKLWHRHFDIYFNPRWDVDYYYATLLGFLSGAKERISYSTKVYPGKEKRNAGYDLFLTKTILNPPDVIHETDRNLFVLKALGLTVEDTKNEVWYDHEDVLKSNELILKMGGGTSEHRLITICNGAGSMARFYPPELLLQALKIIADKEDCDFVYIGAPKFAEVGNFLKQFLGDRLIDLSGKTSLRVACAIVAKTSMYIGADTGTMHIAAALRIPIIMLGHEASDYQKNYLSMCKRFSPWQSPTIILQPPHALKPCCDLSPRVGCIANVSHCIAQIPPEEIATAFENLRKITYNSN